MSKHRFEFRAMVEEDREELAQLVAECFAARETVTKYSNESVQICYDTYAKPVAYSVLPNLSFVCVDHFSKNGKKIIGCLLCNNVEFEEMEFIEPLNESKAFNKLCNDFKQRFLVLHKDDKVKDYLFNEVFCVKDEYGNQGIATNLFYLALSNAKQLGYQFALVMPTANEVIHIAKDKLKARKIFGVRYDEVEYNGIKYFKGITDPTSYDAYEIALTDFNSDKHRVELLFDW